MNKNEIKSKTNFDIITGNLIRKGAEFARRGNYARANVSMQMGNAFLMNNNSYSNAEENRRLFVNNMSDFNRGIQMRSENENPMSMPMGVGPGGMGMFNNMNMRVGGLGGMPMNNINMHMPLVGMNNNYSNQNNAPLPGNILGFNDNFAHQMHSAQNYSLSQQYKSYNRSSKGT